MQNPTLQRWRSAAPGQAGSSLIEVLVAMAIISLVVFGVMAGFTSTAKISASVDQRAEVDSAVASISDRLTTMPYRACSTVAEANADYIAWPAAHRPAGFTVEITAVSYLAAASTAYVATCGTDQGAQLITLRVVADGVDRETRSSQIVLRNPVASPT